MQETIIVLDFGSQYSQLIARRVRENRVYCEILPCYTPVDKILEKQPKGIILSGGPASVYQKSAPRVDKKIFLQNIPILGICYGMQLGVLILGGKVFSAPSREYGRTELTIINTTDLFKNLPAHTIVWMSHGDRVTRLGHDFQILAYTSNSPFAAVRHKKLPFYGVQFHPEVTHTILGNQIFHNFLYEICHCQGTWEMRSYIPEIVQRIRQEVGEKRVLCGLSGGIDSTVTAILVHQAIGERVVTVLVDNGLLREGEVESIKKIIQTQIPSLNLEVVNAQEKFLKKLRGVTDPEEKRRIIGHEFIAIFKKIARKFGKIEYLAQGTLYPDVIESVSVWGGPTARIKSHHNVGGLPAKLPFKLVEPLKYLFKDEVREIGRQLNLPQELIHRQPFPGPGLAVRIIGEVTPERLKILRQADAIIQAEIEQAGLHDSLWQYFAVLLPIGSVGVMGDKRTYENTIVIRAVESIDGMTADWAKLPYEVLDRISSKITSQVRGINRIVFDVTSKPPSTIEWE